MGANLTKEATDCREGKVKSRKKKDSTLRSVESLANLNSFKLCVRMCKLQNNRKGSFR